MQFIDKYGYPVETIKGRGIQNFFRRVIHTRRIKLEIKKEIVYNILFGTILLTLAIGLTIASLIS